MRRFVDDPTRDRSRYCARESATTKNPEVFAAASDLDNASFVDLFAVKRNFLTFTFDAVAAFSWAVEEELVFLRPPQEYTDRIGQQVLWQCLVEVTTGRNGGARNC